MLSCALDRRVFHFLPRESCSPEVARLALLNFFFYNCAPPARQFATCAPARQFTAALFFRDVMAAACAPRPSWTVPCGRNSVLPDSKHTCSHDVALRISKQAPRFEGFPTRTHVLCSSELYKHARVENPSSQNPYPAYLLSVCRIGYLHRGRFRTGFHSRSRARGGLVRSTARTSRSLPCKPGAVPKTATRPLSLV